VQAGPLPLDFKLAAAQNVRHVAWLAPDHLVLAATAAPAAAREQGPTAVDTPPQGSDVIISLRLSWPGLPDLQKPVDSPSIAGVAHVQLQHSIVSLVGSGHGAALALTAAGSVLQLQAAQDAHAYGNNADIAADELHQFPEPCELLLADNSQVWLFLPRVSRIVQVHCL
jgi:hypothetical protein